MCTAHFITTTGLLNLTQNCPSLKALSFHNLPPLNKEALKIFSSIQNLEFLSITLTNWSNLQEIDLNNFFEETKKLKFFKLSLRNDKNKFNNFRKKYPMLRKASALYKGYYLNSYEEFCTQNLDGAIQNNKFPDYNYLHNLINLTRY